MRNRSILPLALVAAMLCAPAIAQPPDFAVYPGEETPGHGRFRQDRLTRMVEYLELSDSQTTEWEAITTQHQETTRARFERIGQLRDEFRSLAEQDNPNLEQVGQIALELHRAMETVRSSRGEVFEELQEILTPEQAERFAALKAAREFSGDRGRRERRGPRSSKDSG